MLPFVRSRERWPLVAPGGRVRLRPLRRSDLRTVRGWLHDPDLVRLAFGLQTAGDVRRVAREYCREMRDGRRNTLGIETLAGRFIGFVRFTLRSTCRSAVARVGILIGPPSFRGLGLGTEAMQVLVGYLFSRRGVDTIELDTAEFNTRAQRCFEKCGFVRRQTPETAVVPLPGTTAAAKVWMELSRRRWLEWGSPAPARKGEIVSTANCPW